MNTTNETSNCLYPLFWSGYYLITHASVWPTDFITDLDMESSLADLVKNNGITLPLRVKNALQLRKIDWCLYQS